MQIYDSNFCTVPLQHFFVMVLTNPKTMFYPRSSLMKTYLYYYFTASAIIDNLFDKRNRLFSNKCTIDMLFKLLMICVKESCILTTFNKQDHDDDDDDDDDDGATLVYAAVVLMVVAL